MVTREQVDFYREKGFLAVEGVFSDAQMADARAVVDQFVETARDVTDHTDLYDLEPTHSVAEPRVRRLKSPAAAHPMFDALIRHPAMLDVVCSLLGPEVR